MNESWLQHSLRSRVAKMEPAYDMGFHPTLKHRSGEPIAVDYVSKKDASSDMQAAAARAQKMNKSSPHGVTVYYAVIPNNVSQYTLQSTLDWVLNTAKRSKREMAVSVKRGLWMSGMVLVGTTKRLIAYWDTDIRSKEVPGTGGEVMPTQAHRPSQERHYDEGIVRYADVNWHTLYYDPDDNFIMSQIGDHDNLVDIASQYGLMVKRLPKTDSHHAVTGKADPENDVDPLVMNRFQLEIAMRTLTIKNRHLQQMVISASQEVLDSDEHAHAHKAAGEIQQQAKHIDVTHASLVNYADKRMSKMRQTKNKLIMFLQYLRDITGGMTGHEGGNIFLRHSEQ